MKARLNTQSMNDHSFMLHWALFKRRPLQAAHHVLTALYFKTLMAWMKVFLSFDFCGAFLLSSTHPTFTVASGYFIHLSPNIWEERKTTKRGLYARALSCVAETDFHFDKDSSVHPVYSGWEKLLASTKTPFSLWHKFPKSSRQQLKLERKGKDRKLSKGINHLGSYRGDWFELAEMSTA